MGYREDIEANFNLSNTQDAVADINAEVSLLPVALEGAGSIITKINQLILDVEDIRIEHGLDKLLRSRQNLFQGRYAAALVAYKALHPEVPDVQIRIADLEEVDTGIFEEWRQCYSYEVGTVSSKVRDAKDKIHDEFEKKITVTEK